MVRHPDWVTQFLSEEDLESIMLCVSELVYTDRTGTNPGPRAVTAGGRICHPSAHRAVRALAHLVRYAEWRRRRDLSFS